MKLKKWIFSVLILSVIGTGNALAADCQGAMSATLNSLDDAIQYGKAVGNDCRDQAVKSTSETNATTTAQQVDGNYQTHSSSQYYTKDLNISLDAGNSKVLNCSGDLSGLSNKDKEDCEAVQFAAKNGNSRPKYVIDRNNDPLITNSRNTINQAKIDSEQNFCRVIKTEIPAQYEQKQCFITTSRTTTQETCEDNVSSVCKLPTPQFNVANGGVEFDTNTILSSDLKPTFAFTNKILRLDQPSVSGWGLYKEFKTRLSFNIINVDKLPSAKIIRIYQDNGLRLFVNGNKVWDKYWGSNSYGQVSTQIDIKPFLKEGENIIEANLYNHKGPLGVSIDIDIPVFNDCKHQVSTTCSTKQVNANVCKLDASSCETTNAQGGYVNDIGAFPNQQPLGYCKKRKYSLTCTEDKQINECSENDLNNCEQLGSECTDKDQEGKCVSYNQTYRCKKSDAQYVEKTICEQKICNGENCIGKEAESDEDFGKSIAMMEAQREAGLYGKTPTDYNIFKGDTNRCTLKVLAGSNIMSCCRTINTNSQFQNKTTGATTTYNYGNQPNTPTTTTSGSQYVYDKVFDDDSTLAVIQSTLTLGWLECNKDEKVLAIKRGRNLCNFNRQWCSSKTFFGACIEKTREYCCFRSTLSKIINTQGRQQLNKGEGCNGFTLDELEKLDFSRMDFSEFINEVVPKDINVEQRKQTIENKVKASFSQGINYYE